jgi:hypothetical protein
VFLVFLACTPKVPSSDGEDSVPSADSRPDSALPPLSWTLVDEQPSEGADLAIAPDGELYASFVRGGHVWIRTSQDGGASWSEATWVNDAGSPSVYGVSHPDVDVDGQRVLVSMPSGHDQALYVSERNDLDFEVLSWVGHGSEQWHFEAIFFSARFAPDGSVWSTFHAFPLGSWSQGWKGMARESTGFALEDISGAAEGLPCECCAHDLIFTEDADVVFAWRGNEDDVRDMMVASGHAGFDTVVTAGDLHPEISYCPVQGPRLAEAPGGELWMTWADSVAGEYDPYVARSSDGGLSWTSSEAALAELEGPRPSPTLAIDGSGRVMLSWTPDIGASSLAVDQGQGWEHLGELEVEGQALRYLELAGDGELLGGLGVDASGRVWFFRLS